MIPRRLFDLTDFNGFVTVVTGGASGIGAATARLLQGRGARVTDTSDVDAAIDEVSSGWAALMFW